MNTLARLGDGLQFVFGGDIPVEPLQLHQVVARTIVVYVLGIALIRIGKSRLLSRLSAIDVLVGFVLGSLLSRGITGSASLSATAASSAALVTAHWLFTWLSCDWHWLGNLIKGHSDLLVKDGQPLEESLRRHHLSRHDLEEQLRLQGVGNLREVALAYKERNGEISVIRQK